MAVNKLCINNKTRGVKILYSCVSSSIKKILMYDSDTI